MKNENKKVTCVDLEGKKYEVPIKKLTFRPAVYGIIIEDNKVLLSKQWDGYDFPGGAVELGETIKEALIREVKEETGLEVKVGSIVACENSFFKLPERVNFVHSILIYYLCEIIGGELSIKFLDKYEKQYADKPEWIDLKEIKSIKFSNSVDSLEILKEAEKIRNKLMK